MTPIMGVLFHLPLVLNSSVFAKLSQRCCFANHALEYGHDRRNEASQYPTILSTRFKFTMYAKWCVYTTVVKYGGFWGNTIYLV